VTAGWADGHGRRVALAASPGGHIDLLIALSGAVQDADRLWVLPEGARRDALAAGGERTAPVRIFGSSPRALLGNLRDVGRTLRRVRPEVVITSGAGVVVPYCVMARVLGARIIYMETMARVTSGSRAGRVLSRIAESTLVQWPESLEVYPGARRCSPPLLEHGGAGAAPQRRGTFVALGTHWQPFTRLMVMVEEAVETGLLPVPVTAQVGEFSYPSRRVTTVPSLPPDDLAELMRTSEIVICHGGAGIIATAIRAGRRPLALARRAGDGEHIDDHQQEIVSKLGSLGLVAPLEHGVTDRALAVGRTDVAEGELPLPGPSMRDALAEALASL
jgi:UDP-N-acetylglucosamine--N-acetylmuramyl-(pentapeptide) pyrophosphoryl-undecaprenol N-acetylglucosamine transferase